MIALTPKMHNSHIFDDASLWWLDLILLSLILIDNEVESTSTCKQVSMNILHFSSHNHTFSDVKNVKKLKFLF